MVRCQFSTAHGVIAHFRSKNVVLCSRSVCDLMILNATDTKKSHLRTYNVTIILTYSRWKNPNWPFFIIISYVNRNNYCKVVYLCIWQLLRMGLQLQFSVKGPRLAIFDYNILCESELQSSIFIYLTIALNGFAIDMWHSVLPS